MNKRQAEVEKIQIEHEKQCVKDLQKAYTEALGDVKKKLQGLLGRQENKPTQSVAHQIKFQRSLESQIQDAIDTLKSGSVTSVTDFLNKTYEDGYLGTIYSIQGQGIPVNVGVDHEQMARTISRKTDSFRFSERLYKNTDELAVAYKSQMTRGIANGSSYTQIAKQISLESEASYNQALRIVRTEGGRVKSEAKLDSMKAAKKEGADIVKQWDATFDGKTRPEHVYLDGQIREIDEPFTDSQGRQGQAPHKFGVASMDINCRCIVLEQPRWAVEDEDVPNKIDNVTGDLIEAKDYKEWKKKAQKQLDEKKKKDFNKRKEELKKQGVKVYDKNTKKVPKKGDYFQTAKKELLEITDVSDFDGVKTITLADGQNVALKNAKDKAKPVKAITEASTIEELNETALSELKTYGVVSVDYSNMDLKLAKEQADQFTKLAKEYKTDCVDIRASKTNDNAHVVRVGSGKECILEYNQRIFGDYDKHIKKKTEAVVSGWNCQVDKHNIPIATTTHEFYHSIFSVKHAKTYGYSADVVKEIEGVKRKYELALTKIEKKYIVEKSIDSATRAKMRAEIFISEYAKDNIDEWAAEAFANAKLSSNPSPYAKELLAIVDKYFRR